MLGKTYAYESKKYEPGQTLPDRYSEKYQVVKNLGIAFRDKGKAVYKLEVEILRK